MKSIHRRQGPLAAGGQEGERHSPLQGPWGPEGELRCCSEAEVKGGDGLGWGAAGVWGIRASVHFPNKEEDVEALGEALRRLRAQGPRQALRYIVMV